jgi:hypothetical protein
MINRRFGRFWAYAYCGRLFPHGNGHLERNREIVGFFSCLLHCTITVQATVLQRPMEKSDTTNKGEYALSPYRMTSRGDPAFIHMERSST